MKNSFSLFSYKSGNSVLHRMASWQKIILLPALSLSYWVIPFYFVIFVIAVQLIVEIILKFSLKDIANDFKPVIFYAVLLYFINFCASYFSFGWIFDFALLKKTAITVFSDFLTAIFLLRFFAAIQACSLLFKTSSSLQIREGFEHIESFFRKILPVSKKNQFSKILALFVCFIPMCIQNWNSIKKAWFARGGKFGIRMIFVLLPVFFSVGMNKAYKMAKAYAARDVI